MKLFKVALVSADIRFRLRFSRIRSPWQFVLLNGGNEWFILVWAIDFNSI